jgi:hypothetical protein
MPSKSAKQHRFMQAIAHSPSFAKKAGVSQSVGKDFSAADKGKTFKKGDMMKKRYDNGGGVDFDADDDPESQKVFRDDDAGGLTELSDEERMPRRSVAAPAAKPAAKKAAPKRNTAAAEYKAAARNKYMEALGYDAASKNKNLSPAARGDMSKRYAKAMKDYDILGGGYRHASDKGLNKGGSIMESKKMMGGGMAYAKGGGIESRGKTKGTVIRMAAGGSVSARADGIAQRGKTKFKNY